MERTKIQLDDFDELFPGESIVIGSQTIIIPPLRLEQVMAMFKKGKILIKKLNEVGVTWENLTSYESLFKIAETAFAFSPDLLEEASNIQMKDLKRLPMEPIVKIVEAIIKVNVSSRDSLIKNLRSLAKMFQEVAKEGNLETPKDPKNSKTKNPKTIHGVALKKS
ncbi:MAG: hypothetical protein GY861_14345 [bacterium]|nr:hypothetical protein [bacterium]